MEKYNAGQGTFSSQNIAIIIDESKAWEGKGKEEVEGKELAYVHMCGKT